MLLSLMSDARITSEHCIFSLDTYFRLKSVSDFKITRYIHIPALGGVSLEFSDGWMNDGNGQKREKEREIQRNTKCHMMAE